MFGFSTIRLAAYGAIITFLIGAFAWYHHSVFAAGKAAVTAQYNADNALRLKQLAAMQMALNTAARQKQEAIAAMDAQYQQVISNDQKANDAAIASIRSGALKLRKRFTCAAASANPVPKTADSSGVSNGQAKSGLQPADAEFLVQLADRADAVVHQLDACQAILGQATK